MKQDQIITFDRKLLLAQVLLIGTYYFVGRIALLLGSTPAYITPVWPSAGLALAATILMGWQSGFSIFLSAFLLHITFHGFTIDNLLAGICIAAGNAIAPLVATAWLQPRIRGGLFEHSRNVLSFVILGGFLSPLISALIGVSSLVLSGRAGWMQFGDIWWTWWTSNMVGVVVFTPLVLTWRRFPLRRDRLSAQRITEFSLLVLLLVGISLIAFWQSYSLEYFLLPLIVWSAFRFRQHGTTLLVVVIGAIAIFSTVRGYGSFSRKNLGEQLLLLQTFTAVISVTALMLSALISEREKVEAQLKQANEALEIRVEERTSALRESEQALQVSAMEAASRAAELRALFSAMKELIVVFDSEGRYLSVAPTNPRILYRSMQEMEGKTLYEVLPPAQANLLWNAIQQTIATQQTMDIEYSLPVDNQEIWSAASLSPISNQRVIFVARDITERKRAEEDLRLSEEKFSKAFRSSANLICITRLEDGRFIEVNESFFTIGGYRREEVIGRTSQDLNLWAHPEQRSQMLKLLQQDGAFRNQECQFNTKSGDVRTVLLSAEVINVRGTKCGLYVMGDITDRKKAEEALQQEQKKSEQLLLNILPKKIADRLKEDQSAIADAIEQATILFADIVDFTPLSARLSPTELVRMLNRIFSEFDELASKYGLEKIKTIGDAYMVAGGLPVPSDNHAEAIAEMALDMKQVIHQFCRDTGEPFQVRVGINTGPVVAGVIGTKKFIYDLWGDTVNIASRMESHGMAGHIQITASTYEKLKDKYKLEARGLIPIKGRGEIMTYWLTGRK